MTGDKVGRIGISADRRPAVIHAVTAAAVNTIGLNGAEHGASMSGVSANLGFRSIHKSRDFHHATNTILAHHADGQLGADAPKKFAVREAKGLGLLQPHKRTTAPALRHPGRAILLPNCHKLRKGSFDQGKARLFLDSFHCEYQGRLFKRIAESEIRSRAALTR